MAAIALNLSQDSLYGSSNFILLYTVIISPKLTGTSSSLPEIASITKLPYSSVTG
jgi:hypothetical protein